MFDPPGEFVKLAELDVLVEGVLGRPPLHIGGTWTEINEALEQEPADLLRFGSGNEMVDATIEESRTKEPTHGPSREVSAGVAGEAPPDTGEVEARGETTGLYGQAVFSPATRKTQGELRLEFTPVSKAASTFAGLFSIMAFSISIAG